MLQRYFSQMNEGSFRASIFSMCSLALGTGCLTIPLQFQQMSVLGGVIALIFSSAAAYWSLNIMILSSLKSNVYDYSKLVINEFGKKWARFLDSIIIIYGIGILVSYQVIIYDLLGNFIYNVSNQIDQLDYKDYDDFKKNFLKRPAVIYPAMFGLCALHISLCYIKNIAKMRFINLFGIISLLYTIIVVIVQFPMYWNYHDDHKAVTDLTINWWDMSTGFTKKVYFFQGSSVFFFAYTVHIGAFPVYKALKNNEDNINKDCYEKMSRVFKRSVLFDAFLYTLIGFCGYLSVYDRTLTPLIINRYSIFKHDWFMIFGRLSISITLIFNLPANYNAMRLSLLEMIYEDSEVTTKRNILITFPSLILTCLVAILYDNIIKYINFMGGFCSVIIAFIFPVLLYVKTNAHERFHYKNILSIIAMIALSIIGFTSCIVTILFD